MTAKGEAVINTILNLHKKFSTECFDSPESLYKTIFQELENLVADDEATCNEVLSDERISKIRPTLQKAYLKCVYELEMQWTKKLVNLETPDFSIGQYPKYEQYRIRAYFEHYLLPTIANFNTKKILFVGCGSLPATPIIMKKMFKANIDFLDISKEAIELASYLIEKLKLNDGSKFINSNIFEFHDFDSYDLIIVAGSIGVGEEEKSKLILHFREHLKSGQFLILRPPYQIEKLLISDFNTKDFEGFKVTTAQIVNDDDIILRLVAQKI